MKPSGKVHSATFKKTCVIYTSKAYLEDIDRKWMTDSVGTNMLLILLYKLGRVFQS